jgi:hypothetical protein
LSIYEWILDVEKLRKSAPPEGAIITQLLSEGDAATGCTEGQEVSHVKILDDPKDRHPLRNAEEFEGVGGCQGGSSQNPTGHFLSFSTTRIHSGPRTPIG